MKEDTYRKIEGWLNDFKNQRIGYSEFIERVQALIGQSLEEGRESALKEAQTEAEKLQSAYDHYENEKAWNALERFKDALSKLQKVTS